MSDNIDSVCTTKRSGGAWKPGDRGSSCFRAYGFVWFQYLEAGSYKKLIGINGASNLWRLSVTAPEVAKKETVHFILKVTDKGTPRLSR
jgi:hypothetical protein